MPEIESLLSFLAAARRRHARTEFVRHGLLALALGLGGLVILLLAGTQIFAWYWPTLLFLGGTAAGIHQYLKYKPTPYRMAQIVDDRLDTHDALSTAFHFAAEDGPMIAAQRSAAARLATGLSPEIAVPMVWPRTTYAVAALTLVAVTLVGVRYGILNTLDLSAPVSEAVIDVFRYSPLAQNKKGPGKGRDAVAEELQKMGLSIDESAKDELTKIEMAKEGEITTSDIPDVNDLSDIARGEKGKASVEGNGTNPGEGEGEGEAGGKDGNPDEAGKEGREDSKGQDAKNAKQGQKGGDNKMAANQNSMLDKMKDAFANMMNKLKMPDPKDGQQQAANQKGGEKGGNSQQKGGQQQGKQPGNGNEAKNGAEQPGDAGSDAAEKQANAQGQGGEKSASMQAPPDAQSGVGKADGDKSIKDAEQLQAVGKISEILGKRAKDIAGEVMVEVNGGKQQLRTQYSNSGARHAESGGEIHRDQVPLQHQQYVQQYFEEVRKSGGPAKK